MGVILGEAWGKQDDIEIVKGRILEDIGGGRVDEQRVKKIVGDLRKDGSFKDVDYKSRARTRWPADRHLVNLLAMAKAYCNEKSSLRGNRGLKKQIETGLEFWYEANPRCDNWWYNQISVPQKMGQILLLMQSGKDALPEELVNNLVARMKADGGNPASQTGANKVDVAQHYIYRACLTGDEDLFRKSLNEFFMPLKYVTAEGIQPDLSYHQHGPQLYIGGYGLVLLDCVTQMGMYVKDTEFALNGEQLDILSLFVRETYLKAIRGQNFSFNVLGRGVTRMNALSQRGFTGNLERLTKLDPAHSKTYEEASLRLRGEKDASYGILPGNRHYYRSDYMLHQRPGFTVDVRTVSNRTARNEQGIGNGEGLKQYFLSDGAMNIVVRGDEYFNIFPVWNWARIPGVTCPEFKDIPLASDWVAKGTATFSGGVSDGHYGAYAYDYDDRYKGINTSARKAWFLFDDEVVCLGNGITSTSKHPVNTTINQCLSDGSAVASRKGRESSFRKNASFCDGDTRWVYHDGIGYYFPNGGKIGMKMGEQEGSWHSINTNYSKDVVRHNVFTLWFDHGMNPENDSYAYIIIPGKARLADLKKHPVNQIEILANDEKIQAVYHKGLQVLQVVFREKGILTMGGMSIEADNKCVLMVRDVASAKPVIYVADVSQSLDKIALVMKTPRIGEKTYAVDLPREPGQTGKTVEIKPES